MPSLQRRSGDERAYELSKLDARALMSSSCRKCSPHDIAQGSETSSRRSPRIQLEYKTMQTQVYHQALQLAFCCSIFSAASPGTPDRRIRSTFLVPPHTLSCPMSLLFTGTNQAGLTRFLTAALAIEQRARCLQRLRAAEANVRCRAVWRVLRAGGDAISIAVRFMAQK